MRTKQLPTPVIDCYCQAVASCDAVCFSDGLHQRHITIWTHQHRVSTLLIVYTTSMGHQLCGQYQQGHLQRTQHSCTGAAPVSHLVRSFKHRATRRSHMAASAASTAASEAVLVQDGVLVPAPATAQQLLAEHRDWSYTSAAVRQQYLVVDWKLHIERLVRNMQVLSQQRPPAYADFMQWHQRQRGGQEAVAPALRQLINPMVAKALRELQHSETQEQQKQAMLVVTVGDKSAASSPSSSSQTGEPPLSVLVWAKPYVPPAAHTAKVLVAGDPRPAAQAKHCDWVLARQPLEQLKQQAGADEVVLSDSSGALLEGLTTNFYVIADAAKLAACGQPVHAGDVYTGPGQQQQHQQQHQQGHDSEQLERLVLLTTGAAADALLGITQQRVLQACQRLQLPVVLQPTRSDTAAAWKEAFLTNCLKGLQPVQQIKLQDGTCWEAAADATLTAKLQQEVAGLQRATNMQQWL